MDSFNALVDFLSNNEGRKALAGLHRGIEREALRVDLQCRLAKDSHPAALGSALLNSKITTDYSEALLEFITPVSDDIGSLLQELTQIHAFSLKQLDNQQLWPVSMPCFVEHGTEIPIARYGNSNIGKMKSLYRQGLTHRYGALMQIISGVHFNFSVSDELWRLLYARANSPLGLQDFISETYFGLIRNYRRIMWLLPYLFGASPALCRSFIQGQGTDLAFQSLDDETLFLPYATSLRMSDLGYTNHEQDKLNISYNSLAEYLDGIQSAIHMPSGKFAQVGIKVNGEYRQLNSNILQIENEFYAPIRPKRITASGEKPSDALANKGVEYIEVRALDVNPFTPVGIDANQIRFLDLFLLYCLLEPSVPADKAEELEIATNLKSVVLQGRRADLQLQRQGQSIALQDWANDIFVKLEMLADLLDTSWQDANKPKNNATCQENPHEGTYHQTLELWQRAVKDPEQTLSGQVLKVIKTSGISYQRWIKDLAQEYRQYLVQYPMTQAQQQNFMAEARDSLERQQQLETSQTQSFDAFLRDYFQN